MELSVIAPRRADAVRGQRQVSRAELTLACHALRLALDEPSFGNKMRRG